MCALAEQGLVGSLSQLPFICGKVLKLKAQDFGSEMF